MLLDMALTELLLAKDYSPLSAQRRIDVLQEFFTWAKEQGITQVEEITRATIRRYIAWLRERPNPRYGGHLSSETQHYRASILRMYLRFCVREGWLDERVVAFFEMPRKSSKVIQVFTRDHYIRLMRATDECDLPSLRIRDKALLSLMFDTGCRAMEVCGLTREAVVISPHESYIKVRGKGRKEREVGLGKQSTRTLHQYLTRGRPASDLPYVFLSRDAKPLTPNAIDRVLYRLRDVAGRKHFEGIRVSSHTIRHAYAVNYMQQGGEIYKLSRLLGHESVSTTERYLRAFQARDARKGGSVLDRLA